MKVYDNPTSIMFQDFQPPAPSGILYLRQTLYTCEGGLLRHFPNFLISQAQKCRNTVPVMFNLYQYMTLSVKLLYYVI